MLSTDYASAIHYSTYCMGQGGRDLATASLSHGKQVLSAASALAEASGGHNQDSSSAISRALTLLLSAVQLSAWGKFGS